MLAERLCEEANGAIPADEREALLFFGSFPRAMNDVDFKRAIGDAKHRAHLNFLYGVAVEEALQLAIEEEVYYNPYDTQVLERPDLGDEEADDPYNNTGRYNLGDIIVALVVASLLLRSAKRKLTGEGVK